MPSRGYLICSVERTGSNLLAHALSGTGIAGRPREYFNAVEQESPWIRSILGDSTIVTGIPKIVTAGTTPNGLFGAKVHWNHFRHLGMSILGKWNDSERVAPYEALRSQLPRMLSPKAASALLESRFSGVPFQATAYALLQSFVPDLRVIWLQRENMVSCAVSHFRARQTGVWYQPISNSETDRDETVPQLDLAEIHSLYCLAGYQQESWQRFFQEHRLSPHCLFYEELVENFESTVRRVLEFLGIHGQQTLIPPPRSLKQSDAVSKEWEARYRTERAETGSETAGCATEGYS